MINFCKIVLYYVELLVCCFLLIYLLFFMIVFLGVRGYKYGYVCDRIFYLNMVYIF